MDADFVYSTDPERFSRDLARLIDAAAAAASRSTHSSEVVATPDTGAVPRSPPKDPRLRNKRAASPSAEPLATKKVKLLRDNNGSEALTIEDRVTSEALTIEDRVTSELLATRLKAFELRNADITSASFDGASTGPKALTAGDGPPFDNTLRGAIRRQWNGLPGSVSYEDLLHLRRGERVVNVDRYVPSASPLSRRSADASTGLIKSNVSFALSARQESSPASGRHASSKVRGPRDAGRRKVSNKHVKSAKQFPFWKLPEEVQKRILTMLLVKNAPVVIDFTWLRSFINGHCRVPSASKPLRADEHGQTYSVPVHWNELHHDVLVMQDDCRYFTAAMELRVDKTRGKKSPCKGLTPAVLRVSRNVQQLAGPIFYGENTFHFPWATTAWMQLESFLATIGGRNIRHLRGLRVHAPLWHRSLQEDYVEGAILDLTSPASKMATVRPTQRDRLLSAIKSSVHALLQTGKLRDLSIDLEHGSTTDHWMGRYISDRQLIVAGEADEYVARKQEGIALLKGLGDSLESAPLVSLHHPTTARIRKYDRANLRSRMPGVKQEAAKYGWQVWPTLQGRPW